MILDYCFENNSMFNQSCLLFSLKVTLLSRNDHCDIFFHCVLLWTWLGGKNSALLHDLVAESGRNICGEEIKEDCNAFTCIVS